MMEASKEIRKPRLVVWG